MHLFFIALATENALSEGAVESGMAKKKLAIKYFTFIPPHSAWVSFSKDCFVFFHILYQVRCLYLFFCIVLSFC